MATPPGLRTVPVSCKAATLSNVSDFKFPPGALDGVMLDNGDVVLVKDQNYQTENGFYVVTDGGEWIKSTHHIADGLVTAVKYGTTNGGVLFIAWVSGLNVTFTNVLSSGEPDTAHLSGTETFTGDKTFSATVTLGNDPTLDMQAATKQYVDAQGGGSYVSITGDTMSGLLVLSGDPAVALGAATKQYVDGAGFVSLTGDTMTGDLTLPGNPTNGLHAATKSYVDSVAAGGGGTDFVDVAGDTMTGFLTLSADPTSSLHAATKHYVDINTGGAYVSISGDTMTGPLILDADPTAALEAATKQYVDAQAGGSYVQLSGDTMTGLLILSADPTAALGAATKQYVDTGDAAALPKAGGTMTGALVLAADPDAALKAATKQYVDAGDTASVQKSGSTMTGLLVLSADPTAALGAATKQYVDAVDTSAVHTSGNETITGIKNFTGTLQAGGTAVATTAVTDSIAADVATNTSDISTNTSNISTNTSNISTNTTNISTNTGELTKFKNVYNKSVPGNWEVSATSWSDCTDTSGTFTKVGSAAQSDLLVTASWGLRRSWTTGGANVASFGIYVNGTDYLVTETVLSTTGHHVNVSGTLKITDAASGALTVKLRTKSDRTTSNVLSDTNDQVSYTIQEIPK